MGRRRKKSNYHELQQDSEPPEQQPKGAKQQRRGANKRKIVKRNFGGEDENFRRILEEDGTKTIVDMAADGNCLFRSVSDQLTWDHGYNHEEVRSDVCDFLELHEEEFSVFLVLDENEDDEDAADFESYISTMRDSGEWGGNLELVAAARLYQRNIKVFSLVAAYTIEHGENKSTGPDLMISYHDNDHYNSLRDSKATKPTCKPVKIMPVRPFLSTPTTAKIEEESTSSESKTSSNGRTRTSRAKTTKEIESPTLGKMEKRTNKAAKKGATGKSESQKPSVGVRKSRRVAGETTIAAVVETTASTLGKSKDKADKKLVVTKSVKKPARRNGKNGTNKESMSKPGQPQVQIEASANMDVDEPTLKKRSASVGSSSQLSGLAASIRSSTKDVEVDPAFNLSDEDLAFAFDKEDKISDTINNSAILAGSTVTKPPIQAFDMDFEPELDEIAVPTGLAAHDELASDSELQSLSSTSTLEDSRNGTSLGESKKNKRLSERVKCFSEDEEDDQDYMALTKPSSESVEKPSTAKKNKKGGKCPCGSGKTYRKCCKEKEKKEKAAMRRSSSIVTDDDDESSSQPKEHEMESGFRVLKI